MVRSFGVRIVSISVGGDSPSGVLPIINTSERL